MNNLLKIAVVLGLFAAGGFVVGIYADGDPAPVSTVAPIPEFQDDPLGIVGVDVRLGDSEPIVLSLFIGGPVSQPIFVYHYVFVGTVQQGFLTLDFSGDEAEFCYKEFAVGANVPGCAGLS